MEWTNNEKKTLYEIYEDIVMCKDVDKEDLRLATLVYRNLLFLANEDIRKIYQNNEKDILIEKIFNQSRQRYQNALKKTPEEQLGKYGIPDTEEFKKIKELADNMFADFKDWLKDNKK